MSICDRQYGIGSTITFDVFDAIVDVADVVAVIIAAVSVDAVTCVVASIRFGRRFKSLLMKICEIQIDISSQCRQRLQCIGER